MAVAGLTVAMNVTGPATGDGFWVDVTVVTVLAFAFTVCVIAAEPALR